jgi:prevent-host-death family protein
MAMARHVSAAEAKARFADCIRKAEEGEPVVITRHGKPVVALVAAGELKQLDRLRSAGPERGLASVAGGWRDSEELVRALAQRRRRGSRRVPILDD